MSATLTTPKTTSGGEIIRELVNASDGAGLHFEDGGYVDGANNAAAEFGTSDFSVEFILNQTGETAYGNFLYFTHTGGNNRLYVRNHITANNVALIFTNSSGTATTRSIAYDMTADYNTPTHYVLTFDRDGDATLYKNGNSVGSIDISAESGIDLGDGNTTTSRFGSSSTYGVLGTFYRFRTWNKLVDAKALFERADVDFADQYGSQTEKIGDAANRTFASGVGNWGAVAITAANDSGALKIPQTAAFGGGTNNLASFAQRSFLGKDYFNTGGATENNKRYRLSFDAKAVTGGSKLYFNFQNNDDTTNTALNESVTLTTSFASYSVVLEGDFGSAPKFLLAGLDAAESFWLDNVSIVAVGCVSDYELSANPTQSLTVQDRAGAADGTASASGVTQVQPVVQLNSTSARIGTTAATPADGQILTSGDIGVGGSPNTTASTSTIEAVNSGTARVLMKSTGTGGREYGLWTSTSGNLGFFDYTAGANRLTIDSSGHVLVGAAALDANVGAKKMQLEGSASTDVGPEMLLHNPAQGGGAASLLTFGGKASGTEGYTAAIKATNTGTLTIGTSSASGGFSEPAARLTISSTGNITTESDGIALKLDGSSNTTRGIFIRNTGGSAHGYLHTDGNLKIIAEDSGKSINFYTADDGTGTARLSIASTGSVNVSGPYLNVGGGYGSTGLSISDAGALQADGLATFSGGIAFQSATTGSGTGTGYTLDKYEEGTWTPVFKGSSTAGTYTVGTTIAKYTRIGNLVTVLCSLINISESSAGAGNVYVTGLPFTSQNLSAQALGTGSVRLRSYTSSGNSVLTYVGNNSTVVQFSQYVSGSADAGLDISGLSSGSSDLSFSLTYFV